MLSMKLRVFALSPKEPAVDTSRWPEPGAFGDEVALSLSTFDAFMGRVSA